jgi:hypothetical protein
LPRFSAEGLKIANVQPPCCIPGGRYGVGFRDFGNCKTYEYNTKTEVSEGIGYLIRHSLTCVTDNPLVKNFPLWVRRLFGVDAVTAKKVKDVFETWLEGGSGGIVIA